MFFKFRINTIYFYVAHRVVDKTKVGLCSVLIQIVMKAIQTNAMLSTFSWIKQYFMDHTCSVFDAI